MCLKLYESNKIYVIGYELENDFIKICTLNKKEVSKEVATDFFNYLEGCD